MLKKIKSCWRFIRTNHKKIPLCILALIAGMQMGVLITILLEGEWGAIPLSVFMIVVPVSFIFVDFAMERAMSLLRDYRDLTDEMQRYIGKIEAENAELKKQKEFWAKEETKEIKIKKND